MFFMCSFLFKKYIIYIKKLRLVYSFTLHFKTRKSYSSAKHPWVLQTQAQNSLLHCLLTVKSISMSTIRTVKSWMTFWLLLFYVTCSTLPYLILLPYLYTFTTHYIYLTPHCYLNLNGIASLNQLTFFFFLNLILYILYFYVFLFMICFISLDDSAPDCNCNFLFWRQWL